VGLEQERNKEKAPPSVNNSPTDWRTSHAIARYCGSVSKAFRPIPLTGGDCFLLARDTSMSCAIAREHVQDQPSAKSPLKPTGMSPPWRGGAPTTIVVGPSVSSRQPEADHSVIAGLILMKADQARTLALHNTLQALASEMAEQAPGSGVVATRLAEVLLSRYSGRISRRNQNATKDGFVLSSIPIGTAMNAIHDSVNTPWTVESWPPWRACPAPHSQPVLKSCSDKRHWNVTEWRMQKAMQLLQERDKSS